MAYPFERTLRSLNGCDSGARVLLVVLATISLGGLVTWAMGARVPVMKVSSRAASSHTTRSTGSSSSGSISELEKLEHRRYERTWLEVIPRATMAAIVHDLATT
jgi:membrane protein YqaA with SNARE-associated domain